MRLTQAVTKLNCRFALITSASVLSSCVVLIVDKLYQKSRDTRMLNYDSVDVTGSSMYDGSYCDVWNFRPCESIAWWFCTGNWMAKRLDRTAITRAILRSDVTRNRDFDLMQADSVAIIAHLNIHVTLAVTSAVTLVSIAEGRAFIAIYVSRLRH